MGLNWFIPALAKRSVGSECGTTEEDSTGRLISTKERHTVSERLLTEFMAILLYEEFDECLTDEFGRPLDLNSIG